MKLKFIFTLVTVSILVFTVIDSNAFLGLSKKAKTEILKPEIKYSKKTFAIKAPEGNYKKLNVEIRDTFDNLLYTSKYEDVNNFEMTYDVSQLPRGKYLIRVLADGRTFYDMIKVK